MTDMNNISAKLESSHYGAMLHVIGVTAPALRSHVAALRIFNYESNVPPTYVDASELDLPLGTAEALQDWPLAEKSIFEYVAKRQITDAVFLSSELADQITCTHLRMFHPIEPFSKVMSAICLTMPLVDDVWAMLVYLRCDTPTLFSEMELEQLKKYKPSIANTLRLGYLQDSKKGSIVQRGSHIIPTSNTMRHSANTGNMLAKLTKTEQQVLLHLRSHATEKSIAAQLHRSPHTVHVHVKNIYRKLNISSRREIIDLFGTLDEVT